MGAFFSKIMNFIFGRKKEDQTKPTSSERGSHLSQHLFDSYVQSDEYFGNNLENHVVAITGTTTGLGFHLTRIAIAKHAKCILLLNRESERSKKAHAELQSYIEDNNKTTTQLVSVNCDLMDFDSVRQCAKQVNALVSGDNGGLDVLCCNAGVMAMKDQRTTKDGHDVQMQTNQLSHFLLAKLVFPSLEQAATQKGKSRIVFHSSSARDNPKRMLHEKYFLKCDPGTLGGDSAWLLTQMLGIRDGPWVRYHQSKLANSAFAMALHHKLQERNSKVQALTCEPGYSVTPLQTTSHSLPMWMDGDWIPRQSAADGSLPVAMACFSPQAGSGDMLIPAKIFVGPPKWVIKGGKPVKKNGEKLTCHPDNQKVVWEASEKALGISFFD